MIPKRSSSNPSTSQSSQSDLERSSGRREVLPDHLVELGVGARGRQGDVADVLGDLEVRVVDPHRGAHLQRRRGELLAQPGQQVQAAADVGDEVVVARRRALADHDRPDRHVAVRFLVGEERRVERRQPVHMALGHRLPPSPRGRLRNIGRINVGLFPYPERRVMGRFRSGGFFDRARRGLRGRLESRLALLLGLSVLHRPRCRRTAAARPARPQRPPRAPPRAAGGARRPW